MLELFCWKNYTKKSLLSENRWNLHKYDTTTRKYNYTFYALQLYPVKYTPSADLLHLSAITDD